MERLVATAALLLWTSASARAAETDRLPQLVQEVFRSELVYPQDAGELQMTVAAEADRDRGSGTAESGLRLEYGLTDAWQVETAWTSISAGFGDGVDDLGTGDLEVGTKYAVLGIGGSRWHAAGSLDVTIPVSDLDDGGVLECDPSVLAAIDVPDPWRAHVFGAVGGVLRRRVHGPAASGRSESTSDGVTTGLGFVVPFHTVRFSVELDAEYDVDGTTALGVTPGTIWELPAGFELGVGVPIGLAGSTDDVGIVAMLTREISLFDANGSEE